MAMSREIPLLLLHPYVFFARISGKDPGMSPPLGVVATVALVSASCLVGSCIVTGNCLDTATIPSLFGWNFIVPFFSWLFLSLVLFFVARLLAGTGDLMATIRDTGYGMLPQVFINPVMLAGMLLIYRNSPGIVLNYLESPMLMSTIVFIVFTLWCCIIWAYAVKNTHNLPLRRSAAAVFISVIIVQTVLVYGPSLT